MTKQKAWRNRICGHGEEAPDQLLANPQNWRIHPKHQQDALEAVIDRVGFVSEVTVNKRTGYVVDGHLRVAMAISRGEPTVPVTYVDLSEEEEALVLTTLDPIGAMASADKAQLETLLVGLAGESDGVRALLDDMARDHGIQLGELAADLGPQMDQAEELQRKWGTERGQVWVVGQHRVMCGDSTDEADVAALCAGERVRGLFTSPPYDQQRTYEGSMVDDWHRLMADTSDQFSVALSQDAQLFVNIGLIHRDGSVVRYWDSFLVAMEVREWPLMGWYVWDKMSGMPGDWNGRLAPSHEWVFHFAREHERPAKVVESKSAGVRTRKSQRKPDGSMKRFTGDGGAVQPFKIPDSVVRLPNQGSGGMGHVAPFPVGLPSAFIRAWDVDTWLDPFLGSGTTLVACEQLGRRGYGMEIEPKYVAVSLERLANMGLTPALET